MFWKRYLREYIPQLQKRMKWTRERKSVKEGDLVLVIDENSPRKQWPMALIVETREGRDGLVRSVKLRSKGTCITPSRLVSLYQSLCSPICCYIVGVMFLTNLLTYQDHSAVVLYLWLYNWFSNHSHILLLCNST